MLPSSPPVPSRRFHIGTARLPPAHFRRRLRGIIEENARPPHRLHRLLDQPSPYLRLHAHNPVDWFPWGEEAFALARSQNKPIFLSIGYYTCHWCHVMERESFSDPAIGELLRRDFVSIKVNREERPDVDRLYMAFVQATTGGGGWPLSAFLTPGLQPFYGGTYFPPQDRYGHPGFARILHTIAEAWQNEPQKLIDSARQVIQALAAHTASAGSPQAGSPGASPAWQPAWSHLFRHFAQSYDAVLGGFGAAPKFPRPVAYSFLLRFAHAPALPGPDASGARPHALAMVLHTLDAMDRGGLHDQIGGGFHRYSTDPGWLVPHFEKMLYDQAQLAIAYLDAWRLTREPRLAAVCQSILDFVLRELTAPDGGFYSAQDADSEIPPAHRQPGLAPEAAEGAYYLWTAADIDLALGPDAPLFCFHFGVRPDGNVPAQLDPHAEFTGKNILHAAATLDQTAAHFGLPAAAAVAQRLAAAAQRLYQLRRQRPLPPTDDKILTAWNGLMISAFAQAAGAFQQPRYLDAARRAARFIESRLYQAPTLYRSWRGQPSTPGFVEDYACLIQGLLDLFEADFDPRWRAWAERLQDRQDELFAAPEGGYYGAAADPHLFLRMREDYDGAEPSPNSIAVSNLLRLERTEAAQRLLDGFQPRLGQLPEALPLMAAHWAQAASPPRQIVIAGDPAGKDAAATQALLGVVHASFLPGFTLRLVPSGSSEFPLLGGRPAAYVCENYACQLPTADPAALATLLRPAAG